MSFATVVGVGGVATLAYFVNPMAAAISASTWALYTMVYTPVKRISIVNTWVGAVVGALPPMIGWAACTGGLEPGNLFVIITCLSCGCHVCITCMSHGWVL